MSRRTLIAVLLALAIIGGSTFYAAELWVAPGHSTPGHRAIAQDCFACHKPFFGTPAERCTVCHAFDRATTVEANGKIRPGSPLLAMHREVARQNCNHCHTSHLTREVTTATPRFDHVMLSAATRAACSNCHLAPTDPLHPTETNRCAACHTTDAWKPATYDHHALFPLEPPHDVACKICHTANNFSQYTCTGCHEHSLERLAREHAEEGITRLDNCVRCHRDGTEHGGRNEREEDRARD